MRRAQVGIAGLIVLVPLIMFFQNCSEQGLPSEGAAGFREGLNYSVAVSGKAKPCFAPESFKCRVYRYSPSMDDGQSSHQTCLTDEESGQEICAQVEELTYDSSRALQLCADCRGEDGRPGGKFHYAEIKCHHVSDSSAPFVVIQDANTSVEGSLYEAIKRCRGN